MYTGPHSTTSISKLKSRPDSIQFTKINDNQLKPVKPCTCRLIQVVTSLAAVTRSKIVAKFLAARSHEARGSLFKFRRRCGVVEHVVAGVGVGGTCDEG